MRSPNSRRCAAATEASRRLPAGPGGVFEYRRGGTLAYFAAYDVHRAHLLGRIAPKTGIEPFADLDDLAQRILAFQDRYSANAEPFDWT